MFFIQLYWTLFLCVYISILCSTNVFGLFKVHLNDIPLSLNKVKVIPHVFCVTGYLPASFISHVLEFQNLSSEHYNWQSSICCFIYQSEWKSYIQKQHLVWVKGKVLIVFCIWCILLLGHLIVHPRFWGTCSSSSSLCMRWCEVSVLQNLTGVESVYSDQTSCQEAQIYNYKNWFFGEEIKWIHSCRNALIFDHMSLKFMNHGLWVIHKAFDYAILWTI